MNARILRTNLRALRRAAETQLHTPAIMTRRLAGLSRLSPFSAALEWNRWAVEKGAIGGAVGIRAMQAASGMWLSMLGTAYGGITPTKLGRALERGVIAGTSVMDPLHSRVKRNAKRKY